MANNHLLYTFLQSQVADQLSHNVSLAALNVMEDVYDASALEGDQHNCHLHPTPCETDIDCDYKCLLRPEGAFSCSKSLESDETGVCLFSHLRPPDCNMDNGGILTLVFDAALNTNVFICQCHYPSIWTGPGCNTPNPQFCLNGTIQNVVQDSVMNIALDIKPETQRLADLYNDITAPLWDCQCSKGAEKMIIAKQIFDTGHYVIPTVCVQTKKVSFLRESLPTTFL
jgi:hypothetical protein